MDLPPNRLKAALQAGKHQIGIWNTIDSPFVSEALAACGYDWILVDAEHGCIESGDILPALQAIAGHPGVSAAVRLPENSPTLIKRVLDFGAQTLMIPFVQSREEAEAAVSAMRYAPAGVRGYAGITRASRFGLVETYAVDAETELCLVVQIESVQAAQYLEDIAAVDGVDAVFIGPADLAASMGLPGQPGHLSVVEACSDIIRRCVDLDVPVGILTLDERLSRDFQNQGAILVAVAVDLALLLRGAIACSESARRRAVSSGRRRKGAISP